MNNKIKFLGILILIISFAFRPMNEKKVIVIDAGHGGDDSGAVAGSVMEKQIVAKLSKKIKAFNSSEEVQIVLLREDDKSISLEDRVKKINSLSPDLLISLHMDSSKNSGTRGVEAYVCKKNSFYKPSFENATNLVELISNNKLIKGEVKDADFYMIKNSKCPALILEVGYLSNENDKNYLVSEEGQNEIANKIVGYLKK